ncbi:unnamed protein product [Trichogramma brassicae]|uniref:Uncharacterized protein n=1 Tax=Trichogramma brassicae TaxID=86971 RepID=A0A6H5IYR7_9HYME|nr:unnamed protein product [Trichogramma brassicae]
MESVTDTDEDADEEARTTPGERFIDFVASSGYKDEPDTDEKNEPLLHRTTPVHRAAKRSTVNSFYSKYTTASTFNYIDEDGLTHFHVACQYGYEAIVAKFLELGQDPNCFSQETRDARYSETPLNLSLINNHQRVAELLLRSGADPNLCSQNGDVPLHIICESFDDSDDDEFVETFFAINDQLDNEVQVNAQNVQGDTPLLLALQTGNKKAVELLLQRDADPNVANASGFTPVYFIGTIDLAQTFFKINDERNRTVEVNVRNKWSNTPLHLYLAQTIVHKKAVCAGNHETVHVGARDNEEPDLHLNLAKMGDSRKAAELLLRRGADPNFINDQGDTCLHIICSNDDDDDDDIANMLFAICDENIRSSRSTLGTRRVGHRCTRRYLIATSTWRFSRSATSKTRTVKVDARDNEGKTPLHYAISHRHKKGVRITAEKKRRCECVRQLWIDSSLHTICMVDDDNGWAKMLFEISEEMNGLVQIDARGMCDFTPLHHALVKEELRPVAELLLRKGAATNLVDWEGFTPLHTVCKYADDEDRVRMLIDISNEEENKPLEVDARDKLGRTPLHLALARGNGQVVKYLLKLGADPNLADKSGFSPLHVVSKDLYDDAAFLTLFCDASKEVNRPLQLDAQDKNGWTPLQWAVANLFLNVVDVLLDQGADLSSFVFPSKSFFAERFGSISEMHELERIEFKLSVASKIVDVVERLEKKGYEFDRGNTLDIMSLFAEYELFDKSTDLEENCRSLLCIDCCTVAIYIGLYGSEKRAPITKITVFRSAASRRTHKHTPEMRKKAHIHSGATTTFIHAITKQLAKKE